jgi:hypothetical protein
LNPDDIPQDEKVPIGGAVSGGLIKAKTSVSTAGASTTDVLTAILCIGVMMIIVHTIQTVFTKPIGTNVVMPPGTIKSKCGIVGYLPPIVKDVAKTLLEPFHPTIHTSDGHWLNCRNEILEVTMDGAVTVSDDSGNVIFKFKGDTCSPAANDDHDHCINGVALQDNGLLKIGNKVVRSGTYYYDDGGDDTYRHNKNIVLSPWPFLEEPKLRFKRQQRTI